MKLTVTFGDQVLFNRDVESCTTEETAAGAFTVTAAFPVVTVDPIDEYFDGWISKSKILDGLFGELIKRC